MGQRITTIEGLHAAVTDILNEYEEFTVHTVRLCTQRIGQKGVQMLRNSSKAMFNGRGKYASGWKLKSEGGRFDTTVTIYNQRGGMPHLLEHGHALRRGGRTIGHTSGRTHIAPVERELVDNFEKELRVAL